MVKLIKEYYDIWGGVKFWNDNLFYIGSNREIYYYKKGKKNVIKGYFHNIEIFNNELWASENNILSTKIIDLNTFEEKYFNFIISLPIFTSDKSCIFSSLRKGNNRFLCKISTLSKEIKKMYPISIEEDKSIVYISYDGSCIFNLNYVLKYYSINNNVFLWEKGKAELPSGFELNFGRIYHKSNLFVFYNKNFLSSIDQNSGKIIYHKQMPTRIITPPSFFDNKVYWFSLGPEKIIHVVDIISGELEQEIIPDERLLDRIIFTKPTITEKYIFITAVSSHEIFILDRQTLTVINITPIENCKSRIPINNSPALHGNILYQLDGDHRLHIFEMEV